MAKQLANRQNQQNVQLATLARQGGQIGAVAAQIQNVMVQQRGGQQLETQGAPLDAQDALFGFLMSQVNDAYQKSRGR